MQLLPFKPHHLEELADYGGQEWVKAFAIGDYVERFTSGPAFSGAVKGDIIGAAGVGRSDNRRGFAWAVLSNKARLHAAGVHRAVKRFLASQTEFDRIEAYVDPEFTLAVRWVEALGFELETPKPMRRFFPDGRSAFQFALVRG
jgi:hypothetical protein